MIFSRNLTLYSTLEGPLKLRTAFASTILLLTITASARASSIVFNGGGPDQKNIYFADSDYEWSAATNDVIPFTLSMVTITGADWWGGCLNGPGGARSAADATTGTPSACAVSDFTLTLYDGSGNGTPGNVVTSFMVVPTQTLTGLNINGNVPEYHYSASFAPVVLPAGTYLFGLSADLPGSFTWGWETTPGGESQHFQLDSGTWIAPPNALGFDLLGPDIAPPSEVPEPATLSLLALGIAGAAMRRRR